MNQSDTPFTPDDPRLTAFALGELDGPEKDQVEAAVAKNPALQQAVQEIRAMAGELNTLLMTEKGPAAKPVDVIVLKQASAPKKPASVLRFPGLYYVCATAAAACFAIVVALQQGEPPASPEQTRIMELHLAGPATGDKQTNEPETPAVESAPKASGPQGPGLITSVMEQRVKQEQLEAERRARNPFPVTKDTNGEEVVQLSPFSIQAARETGYVASSSLAGGAAIPPVASGHRPWTASPAQVVMAASSLASPAEAYAYRKDSDYTRVSDQPTSTFAIDVDTASYSNVRRMIVGGTRPPVDAVRIEELINYFPYRYAPPTKADVPVAAHLEVASAPWKPEHRLVRVGLKGREVSASERGAANLVFLLDVSGSMSQPNKLPLVQESMRLLLERLKPDDRVAIVTYAGRSGLALASTPVAKKQEIVRAIDELTADGSTNGAMGIQLAYDIAKANRVDGGLNRVILCTDGDFNVGVTSEGDLVRLVEEKAKSGVFLTVLGFGMGNLKDSTLELLADKGNGHYGYIDTRREAQKMLVEQVSGTLVTIAKDVKVQVEFNPTKVQSYRLIGYENRLLRREDFSNDQVDAGEMGAGHTVTALYEIVPVGTASPASDVEPLRYTQVAPPKVEARLPADVANELLSVKIRYKEPTGETSRLLEFPLVDWGQTFDAASEDFQFAAAVAGFGLLLRDSPHRGSASFADVSRWAERGAASDTGGYRSEFLDLVRRAETLYR